MNNPRCCSVTKVSVAKLSMAKTLAARGRSLGVLLAAATVVVAQYTPPPDPPPRKPPTTALIQGAQFPVDSIGAIVSSEFVS